MTSGIFLIQDNGDLVPMSEAAYDSEDLLQELLAKYPDLLAGDQMESSNPRRWLLIRREMGIPAEEDGGNRWSVDHLFLDQDGVPTLVEVKRSTDTRIRREVIGQMLDYAANAVVYWPVEEIRSQLERACEAGGMDSAQQILQLLDDASDEEEFWRTVKTNLQAGKVRMVFVADVIPRELRRIVEFLNEQMDPAEVLAVEIKQFVGQGMKSLVPRVMGQTAEAEKKKGPARERKQWDRQSFFAEVEQRHSEVEASVYRKLFDWIEPKATRFEWGKGKKDGFVAFHLDNERGRQRLFNMWTSGIIEIPFGMMQNNPPFSDAEKRNEFLRQLNEIPNVSLSPELIDRWPRIEIDELLEPTSFDKLIEALEWAVREIENSRL